MKYIPGLVFCFLLIFTLTGSNLNCIARDTPKGNQLISLHSNVSGNNEFLFPEVLTTKIISGKVFHAGITLVPFPGVTVTFSNLGSVVTNDTGYYSMEVTTPWTGTVTPYYCGYYDFSPIQRTYTGLKVDRFDQDFVGTPNPLSFTIYGTITNTEDGLPLENFLVDFGNGYTATTNEQGQYSVGLMPCFSYTLTPASDDYNFNPLSLSYTNVTTDFYEQDYSATPSSYPLPPGWDYVNTGTAHIIAVMPAANPKICGVPLQQGDWLGVFYVGDDGQLHCGGAGMYTGGATSTPVIAQGDDTYTTEKDGFGYAEVMNWKVFSSTTTKQEFIAFPTMEAGGWYKWYPMGLSKVISLPAYKTQNLVIQQGWSGISSYLLPATSLPLKNIPSAAPRSGADSISRILAPILNSLVIVKNLTKTYWPAQNINTIGKWSPTSGYIIKVTAPVTLPIIGCDYSPKTANLISGWNIIPVLSDCNVEIETLFAANLNNIVIIKEIAGSSIYWPAMDIKTLLTFTPGKAYFIAATQNFSVTFPACTAFKDDEVVNPVIKNNSPWNDPVMTPSNHAIALPSSVLNKLMAGDVIGAFTAEGICTGLVQVNDLSHNILLQVFGDDPTTIEKEGYLDNEMMKFKLYRPQSKQEFEIGLEFNAALPSSDGLFTTDGMSAASKIIFDPTYIGENGNPSISFYPNPGNSLIEFVAGDAQRNFRLTILDLTGQKAYETSFSGKTQVDLSDARKGIYIVRIESGNLVKVEKMVIR